MRKPAVLLGMLILMAGALSVVFITVGGSLAQAQPGAPLTIYAGQGTGSVAANDFIGDPNLGGNTVRVPVGGTVTWRLQSDENHTVTFPAGNSLPDILIPQPEDPAGRPGMLNPQVFLPSLPSGPWDGTSFAHAELTEDLRQFSITFSRAGRYPFFCLFHPTMTGAIDVVSAGSPGISTQDAIDQQATLVEALRRTQAATIFATRNRPTRVEGARGTDVWFVRAGTSWRNENLDVQAFLPSEITVPQGDTIVWYVDHVQPHTVTFRPTTDPTQSAELFLIQLPGGSFVPPPAPGEQLPPEITAAFLDPDNPPRLVIGPGGRRAGNAIYDGRGLYSSGFIGEHPRVAIPMEKLWGLTFNTPGTFQYVCLLHEDLGMKGTINVQPR